MTDPASRGRDSTLAGRERQRLRRARAVAAGVLAAWTAAVLVVTLSPAPASPEPQGLCLLCSGRALADALLNVALFVPAGAAVVVLGGRPVHALVLGVAASFAIEVLQLFLPGRYPTPLDVLSNGSGALLGTALVRRPPSGVRPSALALAAFLAVLAATRWLGEPRTPPGRLYAQWRPVIGGSTYGGRVLSAAAGPLALPDGPLPAGADPDAPMRRGEPLTVRFLAAPAGGETAGIFAVVEPEAGPVHVLLARNGDLVYGHALRAGAFRLDEPYVVVPDGLSRAAPGDTVAVQVRRLGDGFEVSVASPAGTARGRLRLRADRGWALLLSLPLAFPRAAPAADLLWTLALTLPLGLVAGGRRSALVLGLVAAAALGFAGALVPGFPPGSLAAAAVALPAVMAGNLLARRWRAAAPLAR